MKTRIAVLASGRGSNLQSIINDAATEDCPYEIVMVISDKKDSGALQKAKAAGIPGFHVSPAEFAGRDYFEEAVLRLLDRDGTDLVVLAGYMRLVGRTLLDSYPGRIMNIHPSLLPSFPGLHGQKDALEYGVRFSGCTVHFVDKGMDTGPIIDQETVPVLQHDTEDTLAARILEKEHMLYPRCIRFFAEGKLKTEGRKVMISGRE